MFVPALCHTQAEKLTCDHSVKYVGRSSSTSWQQLPSVCGRGTSQSWLHTPGAQRLSASASSSVVTPFHQSLGSVPWRPQSFGVAPIACGLCMTTAVPVPACRPTCGTTQLELQSRVKVWRSYVLQYKSAAHHNFVGMTSSLRLGLAQRCLRLSVGCGLHWTARQPSRQHSKTMPVHCGPEALQAGAGVFFKAKQLGQVGAPSPALALWGVMDRVPLELQESFAFEAHLVCPVTQLGPL
eukprot:jgi/Botrbrau1/1260/Bobra.0163s0053.1